MDIIEFVETVLGEKLCPHQKEALKILYEGGEIFYPKQYGREWCLDLIKKYEEYMDKEST